MKHIFGIFKKLSRKRKLAIALAVVFLLVFIFARNGGRNGTISAKVERGTVNEELVLTGSVSAEKYAKLSFPTSGKISWVGVVEGQKVVKWQAVASLDKTVLNASYMQALNNYRSYQAAADSTLDSLKDHDSDESFAQKATRTAVEVARDNAFDAVTAAKYNLDNATILTPFSGVITSLPFPFPGVNVSFADTIAEIVDPSTIYFDVNADQSEVTDIKEGQDVLVILDSYQDKKIKGKVTFVSFTPKAGEAGAVYEVKVVFDKGALESFLPRIGMTGDAKFILSQKENVLYAPSNFINTDSEGKYVNLGKPGNKARVETGTEGEDLTEIISGVNEGDILYD